MQNEKTHENPPPISGGYGRRLKKEESAKGFTLVELIVVIVILAILAAILIPGLLKWIDQAKDKKYELEAREIALAAEAALTKVYADGVQVYYSSDNYFLSYGSRQGEKYNFMQLGTFAQEIEKLTGYTDAEVRNVFLYGNAGSSGENTWGGSITGIDIYYLPDGVKTSVCLQPGSDSWVIIKNREDWPPFDF